MADVLLQKKSSSNGFDIIYKCLLVYKELNGHLMVPKRYVVPEHSEYPREAWGMKIGHSVCNIRNIGSYSEHRDKLEAIGFTFKLNVVRPNVGVIHNNNNNNNGNNNNNMQHHVAQVHANMMVGAGGVGVVGVGVMPVVGGGGVVVDHQHHQGYA